MWRFLVEHVLGVQPEACEAMVARTAHGCGSVPERARALARGLLPRATLAGLTTGWAPPGRRALVLALVEERASLRRRALFGACLGRLDDPRFFERDDWPRRALAGDRGALEVVAREGARLLARYAIVRGARRAGSWLAAPLGPVAGAGAAAAFDALDHTAFATSALDRLEDRDERTWIAPVVPLRAPAARRTGRTETEGSRT